MAHVGTLYNNNNKKETIMIVRKLKATRSNVYPNNEPISEKLPNSYRISTSEKKCMNCAAYSESRMCTAFQAPVWPLYVCDGYQARG